MTSISLSQDCQRAAKLFSSLTDTVNGDNVIPLQALLNAKGFAFLTVTKAGLLVSARAGSGLVICRLGDGTWSAPSAIGTIGAGVGLQAGVEVGEYLVILNSRDAVGQFMSGGSMTLGTNMSISAGPLGRSIEGSGNVSKTGDWSAMFSYSKTKGIFGGASIEGSVLSERTEINTKAYGYPVTTRQLLSGQIEAPPFASTLISVLSTNIGKLSGLNSLEGDSEGVTTPTRSDSYAFGTPYAAGGNEHDATSISSKRSSRLFSLGRRSRANSTLSVTGPSHTNDARFDTVFTNEVKEDKRPINRTKRSSTMGALPPGAMEHPITTLLRKSRSNSVGPSDWNSISESIPEATIPPRGVIGKPGRWDRFNSTKADAKRSQSSSLSRETNPYFSQSGINESKDSFASLDDVNSTNYGHTIREASNEADFPLSPSIIQSRTQPKPKPSRRLSIPIPFLSKKSSPLNTPLDNFLLDFPSHSPSREKPNKLVTPTTRSRRESLRNSIALATPQVDLAKPWDSEDEDFLDTAATGGKPKSQDESKVGVAPLTKSFEVTDLGGYSRTAERTSGRNSLIGTPTGSGYQSRNPFDMVRMNSALFEGSASINRSRSGSVLTAPGNRSRSGSVLNFGAQDIKTSMGIGTGIALYDFNGTEPGDLSFHKGDEILIIKQDDNKWWTGIHKASKGLVPSNYLSFQPTQKS